MIIKVYKKNSNEFFTFYPYSTYTPDSPQPYVWLQNKEGDGMQVESKEIDNVIYEALEKYFKENY